MDINDIRVAVTLSSLALFVALGGISYAVTERAATSFSSSGKW